MKPGDYLVSSDDLWRVYNDGQGNRLQCVLENVSGVNPDSQHGKCLADMGIVGTGKRVVAVGNRNGAIYDGAAFQDTAAEVLPGWRPA